MWFEDGRCHLWHWPLQLCYNQNRRNLHPVGSRRNRVESSSGTELLKFPVVRSHGLSSLALAIILNNWQSSTSRDGRCLRETRPETAHLWDSGELWRFCWFTSIGLMYIMTTVRWLFGWQVAGSFGTRSVFRKSHAFAEKGAHCDSSIYLILSLTSY